MRLKLLRSGRERDDFVGKQIRLDRRDPVAIDPSNPVERPQQIDEPLAGRFAEVARIDSRQHDFAPAAGRNTFRLGDQIGDRQVAACAPRQRDRAIAATIVAAVLHFQERAGPVPGRERGEKRGQLVGLAAVNDGPALASHRSDPLEKRSLVAVADDQIDTLDRGQFPRPELGIASGYGDQRARILPDQPSYQIAAFLIGMLGYRTTVHDIDVGGLPPSRATEPAGFELARDRGCLRKVHLAAQRIESDLFPLRHDP